MRQAVMGALALGLVVGAQHGEAADAATTNQQVKIEARFIEKAAVQIVDADGTSNAQGYASALTAPKVTVVPGQPASIRVVKELFVAPGLEKVEIGVTLDVTATVQGSRVALAGKAFIAEKTGESEPKDENWWLAVRRSEVLFSLKPIGPEESVVVPMQLGDRPIEMHLKASLVRP